MRSAFAALLALLLQGANASAQPALQTFRVTYAVLAHGIEVGQASYAFDFTGDAYVATSSRRSTGLAHMLMGERQDFTYAASGEIDGNGHIHPRTYRHEDGRRRRVVNVTFDGDIATTSAQPPMGMGNPPATLAQRTGVVDQVSLFAQMLLSVGSPCQQTAHVFMDGRSRFDLVLTPNGQQQVSIATFRGQGLRCGVQFQPIAGFSDPQPPAQLTFLFAPVHGYFVPLSIEMPTQDVGIVRLEARSFSIVGQR